MALDVVARVLSWAEQPGLHAELRLRHEAVLGERLDRLLATGPGASCAEAIRGLGADARRRLLTAPETAHRITYRPALAPPFLPGVARAEAVRAGVGGPPPEAVWTALGDAYFPAGASAGPADDLAWSPDRAFAAPRVADVIPVDHWSPWGARPGKPVPRLSPGALRGVVAKLDDTLRAVAEVSAAAHALVTNYVRVFVLWSDGRDSLMEFSTERYVGRVVLSNVEAAGVDAVALASAAVHEATHSFVYTLEEWDPIVVDRELSARVQVASPWTGRMLGIHSFVQAACVWLGLWQFFARALEAGVFERGRVEEEMEKSRAGFFRPGLDEAMRASLPHVSPSARAVLEPLVEAVRKGAYG
jgi:hypothetical protein